VRDGDGYDFHDSPNDVKNGRYNHSDKKEQERVIHDTLHDGDPYRFPVFVQIHTHDFAFRITTIVVCDPITVATHKTLGEIRIYVSRIGGQMAECGSSGIEDFQQYE
jgi:hypothetical protein